MEAMIERWAIRLALGNNGGSWESHYTEKQKNFWRQMTSDMIQDIKSELESPELISLASLLATDPAEG